MRKTLTLAALVLSVTVLLPSPAAALPRLASPGLIIDYLLNWAPTLQLVLEPSTKVGPGIDPLGSDGEGTTDDGVRIDPYGAPAPSEGGATSTSDGSTGG